MCFKKAKVAIARADAELTLFAVEVVVDEATEKSVLSAEVTLVPQITGQVEVFVTTPASIEKGTSRSASQNR